MSLAARQSGRARASSVAAPATVPVSQFVAGRLGTIHIGVDITRVQEVTPVGLITQRREMPGFVTGVATVRGRVLPVVDLRSRFGLPHADGDEDARILVAIVHGRTVGFVVDGVIDVIRVHAEQIVPPRVDIPNIDLACVAGCVRMKTRTLLLLNIDNVISKSDLAQVPDVAE